MDKGNMDDEKQKTVNAKTVETVLNYSECPVCFETLASQIYQCENGHIVCNNCIEKMEKCGQCRATLNQGSKIRNIALENICQNLNVPCPNKSHGCGVFTTINQLKNHLEVCCYKLVNVCSKVLGWKDCNHLVSDSSILSHLETDHSIKKVNSKTFRISLNGYRFPLEQNEYLFDPLVVTSLTTPLLIRSLLDGSRISFTCLMLKSINIEDSKKFQVKFFIESPKKEVRYEWSGYVQSYKTFKEMNIFNSFRIPVNFFECDQSNVGRSYYISVKVAVWQTNESILLEDENIYEEVNLVGRKTPHNPDLSSAVVFSKVACDVCKVKPIRCIRYKCLECRDYDLCSKCMELGHHNHHVFARINDLRQNARKYAISFRWINNSVAHSIR